MYTSNELFHFVGHSAPENNESNYEILKKILRLKCISHPPHENGWGRTSYKVEWDRQLETNDLIIPTVTCYADIPFEFLSIHTGKYGKFGISLPLSLLVQYGARPVIYVPMRSDDWSSTGGTTLLRDVEAITRAFKVFVVDKIPGNDINHRTLGELPELTAPALHAMKSVFFKDFLAYIKPYNSELPHNHPENYYMEREWRKYGNMKFKPEQASKLIVAKGYGDRVKRDFPEYDDRVEEI